MHGTLLLLAWSYIYTMFALFYDAVELNSSLWKHDWLLVKLIWLDLKGIKKFREFK